MELQIFKNAESGSVRSAIINGKPFLVGNDVAEILDYVDLNKAIVMYVDEDDKLNDKTASSLGQVSVEDGSSMSLVFTVLFYPANFL